MSKSLTACVALLAIKAQAIHVESTQTTQDLIDDLITFEDHSGAQHPTINLAQYANTLDKGMPEIPEYTQTYTTEYEPIPHQPEEEALAQVEVSAAENFAQIELQEAAIRNYQNELSQTLAQKKKKKYTWKERMERRCERKSYTRELSQTLASCGSQEKWGFFCYPQCDEGYVGVDTKCTVPCPAGWSDNVLGYCEKPNYKMGSWASSCKSGYSYLGRGLDVWCRKDCPKDMPEHPTKKFCKRNEYDRGGGSFMSCGSGAERWWISKCYDFCEKGTKGIGSECYAEECFTPKLDTDGLLQAHYDWYNHYKSVD